MLYISGSNWPIYTLNLSHHLRVPARRQFIFSKMMMFLFAITASQSTRAQSADSFSYTIYNTENGLPQNSVKYIDRDKNGYLWLGTNSALLCFDGKHFKSYYRDDNHNLKSERIDAITLMEDGNISSLANREIYCFDDRKMAFYRRLLFDSSIVRPYRRGWFDVHALNNAAQEAYYRFRRTTYGSAYVIRNPKDDQTFIVSGPSKLAYLDHGAFRWIQPLDVQEGENDFTYAYLNNQLFYLDATHHISAFTGKGEHFTVQVTGDLPERIYVGKSTDANRFFHQDDHIYLVFNSVVYECFYVNKTTLRTVYLISLNNIPDVAVYRYYPDWQLHVVGSRSHGLFLLKKKQFTTLTLPGKGSNVYYEQAAYGHDKVLTRHGILGPVSSERFHKPIFSQQTLFKAKDGTYWTNGIPKGYKPPGNMGIMIHMDSNLHIMRIYLWPELDVVGFAQTPDSTIWINSRRRTLFYIRNDSLQRLDADIKNGLNIIFPLNNRYLLLGGIDHLSLLDVQTRKQTRFGYFNDKEVRAIYRDTEGTIWIGTYGNGYYAYRHNKMTAMPQDASRFLDVVHTFLEDTHGHVWITTNNGLFLFRKQDMNDYVDGKITRLYHQYFDKSAGFNTNEFNGGATPAGIRLGNGKLSLPSLDGLVQFYPDSIKMLLPDAGIFINGLSVDGEMRKLDDRQLPPGFSRLELYVSSPYFGNHANQVIEYSINNKDRNWYPVPADGTIIFNNLPHGSYKLSLRKLTGFGPGNIRTTDFPFTVKPRFTEIWGVQLTFILMIASIVLLIFHYRYKYLTAQKVKLEREVTERTADQQRLIGELQQSDRLKEKVMQVIAHDMQSQLHFVSMLAGGLEHDLKNSHTDHAEAARNLKHATSEICRFAEDFGLWTSAYSEGFQVQYTTFLFHHLVEELRRFFSEIMKQHQNIFIIDAPEHLTLHADRQLLHVILRNLVDNANKYTYNGWITIGVTIENGMAAIRVSDTGEGISEVALQKIRKILTSGRNHEALLLQKGDRLGYQLIADFIARMNNEIEVTSKLGEGTTIILSGFDAVIVPDKPVHGQSHSSGMQDAGI